MIVRSLELSEYRNYEMLKAEFHPGINLIYGSNAQGKTNLLEAIYECATARSHRGSKDREIISFGQEEAHIRLIAEKRTVPVKIDLHFRKSKAKGAAIDGVPITRVSELFGVLNTVFFSPEDLKIIKNGPAERRRFLDMELCQLSRVYTSDLMNYNKAVFQRNALLKDFRGKKDFGELLDVWDEQLLRYGTALMKERRRFIAELGDILQPIHDSITGGAEELSLEYEPSIEEEVFSEKLFLARNNDIGFGSTTIGPHRDDMAFYINGIDSRKYGSQGQQRTAALSLKLAEIELVRRRLQDTPVLLLDDVLSELDASRRERLLGSLCEVQTFISCTGLDDFVKRSIHIDRKFYVQEGKLLEEKEV